MEYLIPSEMLINTQSGQYAKLGGKNFKILKKVGTMRIDEDMPSYEGEHLLGHEGERVGNYEVQAVEKIPEREPTPTIPIPETEYNAGIGQGYKPM